MSTRTKTPPPPSRPAPATSPMAPPATPAASSSTSAGSSNGVAPRTPALTASPSIRTPNGRLRTCSADPALMTVVKVHTAKCTECDKRNKATMLRCPGCTFQICHPCRERREKNGRDLAHGGMMSPGGMGSGMGGLGSGSVVRRRVPSMSPVKKMQGPEPAVVGDAKDKGKAIKKRATAKGKSKVIMLDDESSDEEFMPDPTSPTSKKNKRRRTTLNITDSPTATSARPSRTAAHLVPTPAYIAPSSPDSGSVSGVEILAPTPTSSRPPATLNSAVVKEGFKMDAQHVKPTGRVHELLEQQGARYEEHLLSRHVPVLSDPVISVPEAVKRMFGDQKLSAEEKIEKRNREALAQRELEIKARTVRGFAELEAIKYRTLSPVLNDEEYEELADGIKTIARKWAYDTHGDLPKAKQMEVARNLDMRLDHLDESYRAQLWDVIREFALEKIDELEVDHEFEMNRRAGTLSGSTEKMDGTESAPIEGREV